MSVRRGASGVLSLLFALGVAVVPAGPADATLSNLSFDAGTAGTPCAFAQVNPLRERYAAFGIHFRGMRARDGGAVLDQCSGFGTPARSGLRFLAFNREVTLANGGVARGPERIVFDTPKRVVRIFVSQGRAIGTATFSLVGRRAGIIRSRASVTTSTNDYSVLRVSAPLGIKSVLLGAADPDGQWVADDLGVRN